MNAYEIADILRPSHKRLHNPSLPRRLEASQKVRIQYETTDEFDGIVAAVSKDQIWAMVIATNKNGDVHAYFLMFYGEQHWAFNPNDESTANRWVTFNSLPWQAFDALGLSWPKTQE